MIFQVLALLAAFILFLSFDVKNPIEFFLSCMFIGHVLEKVRNFFSGGVMHAGSLSLDDTSDNFPGRVYLLIVYGFCALYFPWIIYKKHICKAVLC